MKDEKNTDLLIIEENKNGYNDDLTSSLKQLGYNCTQSYSTEEALQNIRAGQKRVDFVILSLDLDSNDIDTIMEQVQKLTAAKIILLSSKEDSKKRESYFQRGIIDYHLTATPLEYIVDDIDETVKRIHGNKDETVLIIDDSRLVRSVVKNLLENQNYNVLCASNAQEGLQCIRENEISLLLLDMELPDIHGTRLLEKLKMEKHISFFPILVLSGSDNPSIVRQALKKGSSDFLRKPIQYEEFLLKIDLWIKSSKRKRTIVRQKKQIENSFVVLHSLVNSTIETIFMFENNICTEVNNEALKLTGCESKSEIIGKEITEIFTNVSKEHTDELLDDLSDHFFEDILLDKRGNKLTIQVKEKNVSLGDKQLKIIAVMDITAIKQKEKILSHQTKMASMGEMIGNIAHQWRQPLTAISVTAGGIKLNYQLGIADEEEISGELDNIINNTQFLSSTIEDFQNFLKDDRTLTYFSIRETLDKTLSIIRANLESHEINIVQNIKENIRLNGLQNDLIQVLLNIINNAADILKTQNLKKAKRYIVIDVKRVNTNIVIIIQDSGGGVPEDILGKVFEPYFTTKHQSKGTGLGLYMTHQIITNTMMGDISVKNCKFEQENTEYFGARFTMTFPVDLTKKWEKQS